MTESAEFLTQSEFARQQGWDKSHVTRLKHAGRLVMDEKGKKVDVAASLAKIKATEDPARDDLRAKHAEQRGGKGGVHEKSPGTGSAGSDFNRARARKEQALADQEEMKARQMRGDLVEWDQVKGFLQDLGATFRAALEAMPDRLAPELVPMNNVDDVKAALVEAHEQLLGDLSLKIERGVQT